MFVSNVLLTLKIMNFEIMLDKSYSFLCYLKHGYIIYIYNIDQYSKNIYIQHTTVNWLWKSWFLVVNQRIYTNIWFKLFCESYLHSNLFWLHFTFIGFRGFLVAWSFEMKWGCMKGKFLCSLNNENICSSLLLVLESLWINILKCVKKTYLNGELSGKG